MKTKSTITALLSIVLILAGCAKESESFNTTPPSGYSENTDAQSVKENMQKIFGVTFNPNHNWSSTTSGKVTIQVNPNDVKKVQLMVCTQQTNQDNEQVTSMTVLNEAEVNGRSSVTLYYDVPTNNKGLYVSFVGDNIYSTKKVENNAVAYSRAQPHRAMNPDFELPKVEPEISIIEDSYANKRGWIPGEKLYQMADYEQMKMAVADYPDDYRTVFRAMVFSYFKNGRIYKNLTRAKSSGLYNDKSYPLTTGEDPIILSPVYKNDGGYHEVDNSDLYYYYFKESEVGPDPVAYFESLPKYKAIQLNQCIKNDDVIEKHASYALVYWGDGTPTVGTKGSFYFPPGYKLGFMVRAKTTAEGGKKQGELYGDGRLNNHINYYDGCNFKSSQLGQDGPRLAWLTVDNRMLMCWESGTDSDFNDIILEVEGGVQEFVAVLQPELNAYAFCFEDRDLGDYDLNDVVVKATRISETQVTWSIVACGAYDELYLMNINAGKIKDNAEIHSLFGKTQETFINTVVGAEKLDPITVTKTVGADFSFMDDTKQPYIYNKTTGKTIKLSLAGQDPHGIMIPFDFLYPREKRAIHIAYPEFNNWGVNPVMSTDWYEKPNFNEVYE